MKPTCTYSGRKWKRCGGSARTWKFCFYKEAPWQPRVIYRFRLSWDGSTRLNVIRNNKKRQCGWRTHNTTHKQSKHNFCYTLLTTEENGTFCNCRAKLSHWCFNFPLRHVHVSPPLVRARAAQPDRVLTQTASFSPPLPRCSVGAFFFFLIYALA